MSSLPELALTEIPTEMEKVVPSKKAAKRAKKAAANKAPAIISEVPVLPDVTHDIVKQATVEAEQDYIRASRHVYWEDQQSVAEEWTLWGISEDKLVLGAAVLAGALAAGYLWYRYGRAEDISNLAEIIPE
jgi:hypothetical protein